MSVSKYTEGALAGSAGEQLYRFSAGKMYIGKGSYANEQAMEDAFDTASTKNTTITAGFDEIGDLSEKPGSVESKVTMLKTKNRAVPGKRTTTVKLNISGLSTERKEFLEDVLPLQESTIVIVNEDDTHVLVFNGLVFSADYTGTLDELWESVLMTEFSGTSTGRIWFREFD